MGFGEKWRGWIVECVSLARAVVLVNGATINEFKLCRGLRQGDPLSPYLFILVTEALHLLFENTEAEGLISGINYILF